MNNAYHCDEEHWIYARGPNVWGRDRTRLGAIKKARTAGAGSSALRRFRKWQITLAPKDTQVDLVDGSLCWGAGHACELEECVNRRYAK